MADLDVTAANFLDQARNSVSTTHDDIGSFLGAQLADPRQRCLRGRLYLTSDPVVSKSNCAPIRVYSARW